MKRLTFSFLLCVLAVLLAFVILRTGGTEAASSTHSKAITSKAWKVVPSPNVGTGDNHLQGVTAITASDAWAVGYSTADNVSLAQVLIEHWDGTLWSVISAPLPSGSSSDLASVTAISTSDVWAVGSYLSSGTTFTLIEHWNGTQWSIVASPNPGTYSNTLNSVTAIATNEVWAVGSSSASSSNGQTLAVHWDGSQWSVVSSPNAGSGYNSFASVTATSTTDVWAAGVGKGGLVEHWNGTQWSIVLNDGFNFTGITALKSKNVWVVGYLLHHGNQRTLTEHWNGSTWSRVANPNPGGLNEFLGVTANSIGNIWAVGYADPHTLVEHWSGPRWSIVASFDGGSQQNFLLGVTQVPGTRQVMAVGYYYVPSNDPESSGIAQTLVEFFA